MNRRFLAFCTALILISGAMPAAATPEEDLKEVARSVRWKSVAMSSDAPKDLIVELPHDAAKLRFAEWVYGTPESPRIAVVVADLGDGRFKLYADKDRDRGVDERDVLNGQNELCSVDVMAQQITDNIVHEYPRTVLFRLRAGCEELDVATVSGIEHDVRPGDDPANEAMRVRQIDGNANGLFADTKDFLQIDINRDGRFDAFLETFPFRPVMEVRGQRWFVKADLFGKRLQLIAATETGKVRAVAQARSGADRIAEMIVTLSGEDGSVYSISGKSGNDANAHSAIGELDLPVGRYAASVLFLALKPDGTDRKWEYTFSREGGVSEKDWLSVVAGGTVEFDAIGELVMNVALERAARGEENSLSLQPQLFTGSGLLINSCQIDGASGYNAGPQCQVSVDTLDGKALGKSSSGFA